MTAATGRAPRKSLSQASCDLHDWTDPGCGRCRDAEAITLRLYHERGTCGGPRGDRYLISRHLMLPRCEWCLLFGDPAERAA